MTVISTLIARLFDFSSGQKIKSADVDAELNMLVAAHNAVVADIESVSESLGNLTVNDDLSGAADTGSVTQIVSWLAGQIKDITGKTDWKTWPGEGVSLSIHDADIDSLKGFRSSVEQGHLLDNRYYTEAEVDAQRVAHNASGDHDARYYLKAAVDGLISGVTALVTAVSNALTAHQSSDDHDGRYLAIGNTTPFTPNLDYEPATVDHVRQRIAEAVIAGVAENSVGDLQLAPENKKAALIAAVLAEVPSGTFDFDSPAGKDGWHYAIVSDAAHDAETYTLLGVTQASRVFTYNTPTAGKTTEVLTCPDGTVITRVYNADGSADITEV